MFDNGIARVDSTLPSKKFHRLKMRHGFAASRFGPGESPTHSVLPITLKFRITLFDERNRHCKSSPVKVLAVSAAPLRELLNFLIYGKHTELLTERARKQPPLSWEKHPLTIKELGITLRVESLDKNGKLFFNCEKTEKHVAVLLDNHGAKFWIHYFQCGIGLVSLSFFSHLASAEGFLNNHTRNVMTLTDINCPSRHTARPHPKLMPIIRRLCATTSSLDFPESYFPLAHSALV